MSKQQEKEKSKRATKQQEKSKNFFQRQNTITLIGLALVAIMLLLTLIGVILSGHILLSS